MIDKSVSKENVLHALNFIDKNGTPKKRNSTEYLLRHERKYYAPKYVLSIATKMATGKELEANQFSGGIETNKFLISLGFKIFKGKIEVGKNGKVPMINICSCIIQYANGFDEWNNESLQKKTALLITIVQSLRKETDLLILPAGFFQTKNSFTKSFAGIEKEVVKALLLNHKDLTICLGIDSSNRSEQMGVAINKTGAIAIARKFHHMNDTVKLAKSAFELEENKKRTFEIKNKKAYIAVCYDTFGISQQDIKNEEKSNVILSLVHIFQKSGPGSSSTDFARKGLAGAAKQWRQKVYASSVFADNKSPQNWPAGIKWSHGDTSVVDLNYSDIRINPKIELASHEQSTIHLNYFKH